MEKPQPDINLPNVLTVIRILLIPLFVIYMIKHMYGFTLLVFTIAGISDALDGLFARYLNQRTNLGAHLDPVADKLLLMTAFISLAILKIIPGWLTVIVISRDIMIISGISVLILVNRRFEINPSLVSKCTTMMQVLTVFFALLQQVTPFAGDSDLLTVLYVATACFTTVSGLHYVYLGVNILQDATTEKQP